MSTTPTTPQWAIEAAIRLRDEAHGLGLAAHQLPKSDDWAAIIAKHAPPLSPPTDEAKLPQTIRDSITILRNRAVDQGDLQTAGDAEYRRAWEKATDAEQELIDEIMSALAPHLSQPLRVSASTAENK